MLPRELQIEQFAAYPPEAKRVIKDHLNALRELPLSFVPSLLREVIDYDYKFPAERVAIDAELANLSSLTQMQIGEWFQAFAGVTLSAALEELRLD